VQEAICAVPSNVSKADLAGPLLTKLVSLWSDDAGHLLREENLHGKVRKKHLAKEIGYRRRIRHGVPATEARQVLGDSEFAIDTMVLTLKEQSGETFAVPSVEDRGLVGSPAHPGGNHLNPYIWAPAINQHSAVGGLVWELAPAWVSSTAEVADRLQRDVLVIVPPAADRHLHLRIDQIRATATMQSGRKVFKESAKGEPVEPGLGDLQPHLVLVPLPVPVDAWSITDCIRAWTYSPKGRGEWAEAGLEMWAHPSGEPSEVEGNEVSPLEVEHPEFSCDLDSYMKAVVSRLSSLKGVVAAGAKVCVVAPMVRGLPRAVEKAIKQNFSQWKLIESRYAFEDGGKTHIGNGTPLVSDAITIWEGR